MSLRTGSTTEYPLSHMSHAAQRRTLDQCIVASLRGTLPKCTGRFAPPEPICNGRSHGPTARRCQAMPDFLLRAAPFHGAPPAARVDDSQKQCGARRQAASLKDSAFRKCAVRRSSRVCCSGVIDCELITKLAWIPVADGRHDHLWKCSLAMHHAACPN